MRRRLLCRWMLLLTVVGCTEVPEPRPGGDADRISTDARTVTDQDGTGGGARDGRAMDGHHLRRDGAVNLGDAIISDGGPRPDGGVVTRGSWIAIAAGSFAMGSPKSEACRDDDALVAEDPHQVTLTHAFELWSTEVTQSQFQQLMGYNPSHFTPCADCPVEKVSWNEAAAYCNALSTKAGLTTCYSCTGSKDAITCQEQAAFRGKGIFGCPGYRLPTEAEWEYAYRAGTNTAFYNGRIDPKACLECPASDNNLTKIAWYCGNSGYQTQPVGQKAPNAWQLYDMAGGVWEWCNDWFVAKLGSTKVTDPAGPISGKQRAYRGGSWAYGTSRARAASRFFGLTITAGINIGFRCARTRP